MKNQINQIKENLKILINSYSVSGLEKQTSILAKKMLDEFCYSCEIDSFNNVIAYLNEFDPKKETIMLDAHIDIIGLIVTAIDKDGFIKAERVGGVDRRGLVGKDVTIHATKELNQKLLGVFCSTPPHLSKSEDDKIKPINEMSIDVGYTKQQAEKLISLGDKITINSCFKELYSQDKSIISSSALDDLAGCACLIDVAKKLNNKKLNLNVCIALSVQEETGASGSKIATFKINPTQAIAVDVSFAKTPDSPSYKCGNLSQGTMIGYAPILNRDMSEKLKNLAIENKIDYQIEIMSSRTGTNCDEIAISQNGVQTALLSIPQKYMHTAIEVVDIKDIICTSNLITQYILSK